MSPRSPFALAVLVAVALALPAAGQAATYTETATTGNAFTSVSPTFPLFLNTSTTRYDDATGTFSLPFDVTLFGSTIPAGTTVTASTNGLVQFGGTLGSGYSVNGCLGSATFGGPVVAAYWDDLEVGNNGRAEGVWWGVAGSAPNRKLVVRWLAHSYFNTSVHADFEVVYDEAQRTVRTIHDGNATGEAYGGSVGATLGIWGSASDYTQFSCGGTLVSPGTAVTYTPTPPPVNVAAPVLSGTADVGQTLTVTGNGTWTNDPTSFEYTWLRCVALPTGGCSPSTIKTETGMASSHVVTDAERNGTVYVRMRASNATGTSAFVFSNSLGPVPATTPPPSGGGETTPPPSGGGGTTPPPSGGGGTPPPPPGQICVTRGGTTRCGVPGSSTEECDAEDPVDCGPEDDSGGGRSPAPSTPKLSLSTLRVSPMTFRAGRKGAALVAAKKPAVPVGTTLRFTLSAPAEVTFTLAKKTLGRAVGGKCVAATRKNAKAKSCTRYVPVKGSFRVAKAKKGVNVVRWSGRLDVGVKRSVALAPNRYQLFAQGRDAAGNRSSVSQLLITIVK